MPDSDASTVSRKRWAVMGLVGVGMASIPMLVVFTAIRLHQTSAFENQMVELQLAHREMIITCTANKSEIEQRLQMMERVIFGDVLPKVQSTAKPLTPRIEGLIVNNQREFRNRLEKVEAQVWKLRRALEQ